MAFSFGSLFHSLGHALAGVFSHKDQINAAISEAQTVANAASIIFAASGHQSAVTEIGKISDGLNLVKGAVTSEASATTLADHATNLGNLANALVTSGDINVKNADTQAGIVAVVNKVQTVVGKVETSLTAAPPPPAE